MLILALDTATEAVTAAVLETAQDEVRSTVCVVGRAAHGERIGPVVEAALAQAGVVPTDLAAVGVGRGPGPYTGLRVGLAHAEVLGWALGIPVHGVCTLDVLAAGAVARGLAGEFLAVTDARRREVYWARYAPGGVRVEGPAVGRPDEVPGAGLPAVGTGAQRYPEHFPTPALPQYPEAEVLARVVAERLAAGLPADVSPLYLRRPDAVPATTRKRVTPR